MDQDQAFQLALELASTSRYSEAQKKLKHILSEKPDHIDALILLGKVEYYLKHYSSSRKKFETVLTYDPGNLTAYFGIEYYKERKQKYGFIISLILILVLFVSSSSLVYCFLNRSFSYNFIKLEENVSQKLNTLESSIKSQNEKFSQYLNELSLITKQRIDSRLKDDEKYRKDIADIHKAQVRLLNNYNRLSDNIKKQIEEISKELKD